MDGPTWALWGSSIMVLWLIQMVFWVGWSEATFIIRTLERWPLPSGLYMRENVELQRRWKLLKDFSLNISACLRHFQHFIQHWLIFSDHSLLGGRAPGFNPGLWHSSHKQPMLLTTRLCPEIHTKRQATQQGYLLNLLGARDKGIEIVYGGGKNILYWVDQSSKGRTKNLLYGHD